MWDDTWARLLVLYVVEINYTALNIEDLDIRSSSQWQSRAAIVAFNGLVEMLRREDNKMRVGIIKVYHVPCPVKNHGRIRLARIVDLQAPGADFLAEKLRLTTRWQQ